MPLNASLLSSCGRPVREVGSGRRWATAFQMTSGIGSAFIPFDLQIGARRPPGEFCHGLAIL